MVRTLSLPSSVYINFRKFQVENSNNNNQSSENTGFLGTWFAENNLFFGSFSNSNLKTTNFLILEGNELHLVNASDSLSLSTFVRGYLKLRGISHSICI